MRDLYTESVVPAPSKPIYTVLKTIFLVLTALSFVATGFAGLLFLIPTAIFAFLLYRTMQKTGGEYEYVHTNDCFDVDLVISNASRKNLISVDLDHVLLVANPESPDMASYQNVPETDYSGSGEADVYAMVYTKNGKCRKLLLRLDSNMYRSLKQWMPGKVK